MFTRNECIEILTKDAPYIIKEYGVKSMCLFGSMARGDNSEDSDVDLFVDMPPVAIKVVRLKNHLQEILGKPVDLIRRHDYLRPHFLSRVEKDAIYVIR